MEFHISFSEPMPDADQLAALVEAEDPAAIAELDATAQLWRVSTVLRPGELAEVLARGGYPVSLARITTLPSVCCGGCSG